MVRFGQDTATYRPGTTADDDLAPGPAIRPTDVEALLAGHIDLHEITKRAWVRSGLRSPMIEAQPASLS